ncbi:MAG: four helix bundle protein [Ignavibacteriaceae bacterium]
MRTVAYATVHPWSVLSVLSFPVFPFSLLYLLPIACAMHAIGSRFFIRSCMLDDLILFQKAYDFFVWLFPIVGKFPKNQRFVLGQQLEILSLRLVEDIMYAQNMHMETLSLDRVRHQIDMIRIHIRLAHDVHLLSLVQYSRGSEWVNELDRIAAALRKSMSHTSHAMTHTVSDP